MSARKKVYLALPEHLLTRIDAERAAAEQREGTYVSRDDIVEVLLTLGLEFGGEPA